MANEKRLIDANALIEVLKEKHDWIMQAPEVSPSIKFGEAICNHRVCEAIEKSPTVDAVEVVHGRWEKHLAPYTDDYWTCTCCNGNFMTDAAQYWHYCPNCGADMREMKDNDL